MAFARFMASPLGRGLRMVLGLALIGYGVGVVGGTVGWVIVGAGFLPFILGLINGCILAPFLGLPFNGAEVLRDAELSR